MNIVDNFSSTFHNSADTEYTRKQMAKALTFNIKRKYKSLSDEEVVDKSEIIMKTHGLSKDNFNGLKVVQALIANNINDVSIDDNSNKNEKTIAGLFSEANTSVKKIAGYDLLYRVMKEMYGKIRAKRLTGEMLDYSLGLSDSGNILIPYCMYGNTPIYVRYNGVVKIITFKKLYKLFEDFHTDKGTYTEVSFKDLYKPVDIKTAVYAKNVGNSATSKNTSVLKTPPHEKQTLEIWDNTNGWVNVSRITRRNNHDEFVLYQIDDGDFALVTTDHLVYMGDGSEKCAGELQIGETILKESDFKLPDVHEYINVNADLAYLLGFILGDGNAMSGDINNSVRTLGFSSKEFNMLNMEYFGCSFKENSFTKTLPVNFLNWEKDSKLAFIAGLIDADGCIHKPQYNLVNIRMMSYATVNILSDIMKTFDGIHGVKKRIDGNSIKTCMYEVKFKVTKDSGLLKYCNKLKNAYNDAPDQFDNYNENLSHGKTGNSICKIIRFYKDDIEDTRFLSDEVKYVYDITTDTSRFYANGMVQHNCYAINASQLNLIGRDFGILPSKPCKRIGSYISSLCETIHQMSSHVAGAIAIGTLFFDIAHLAILKMDIPLDNLKDNVKTRKHFENELQQFVHCVTEDTEVLTPTGFKTYNELHIGDPIYTWKDGHLNTQQIDALNVDTYNGEMHRYSGRCIEQVVTPEHRVLYHDRKHYIKKSSELIDKNSRLNIPINAINDNNVDIDLSDDLISLLAIILTDGSLMYNRKKLQNIIIKKSYNRFGIDFIKDTLDNLNYTYSYKDTIVDSFVNCNDVEYDQIKMKNYIISKNDSEKIFAILNNTREEIPKILTEMSNRQCKLFTDIWSKFSGYYKFETGQNMRMQCDNENVANTLQHILFLAGYGSRITYRDLGNDKDTLYVIPYHTNTKTVTNKEKFTYDGVIWCPTTKDGVVVFRKNGKIFISGNSVNHLSRNSNECVTEDTEVLTPSGFKSYNELHVGDPIYTWKDGNMEIQPTQRVNVNEYDGIMHQYEGRDYNQVVTPNHNVLRKKYNSHLYELIPSSEIFNNEMSESMPVAFNVTNEVDFNISDDMLKLCTIVLCDETYGEYEVNDYSLDVENSKEISTLLDGKKTELPSWFTKLSQRQANIVIDTWKRFDGHCEDDKTKLQCDNHVIADQLQHLVVLAGYGSIINERIIGKNKTATIYVNIYQRKNKQATNKNIVHYKGKVWCPTTENGIVVYRKDGRIFISGNSPFTNISIFGRGKIKYILENDFDWYFTKPEDSKLTDTQWVDYCTEYIYELQKLFVDFFDKGDPLNNGLPYRFPIVTINFSKKKSDGEWKIVDDQLLSDILEKDIYRYNIFTSEGSKVASCCFDANQNVLYRSSDGIGLVDFKTFINDIPNNSNTKIFHNGFWKSFKKVKIDYEDKLYKIVTENGKCITVTGDHEFPTLLGDKRVEDLTKDDHLMSNTKQLAPIQKLQNKLTYEQGYLIGYILGDGSFHTNMTGITLSLNEDCVAETVQNIKIALNDFGIEYDPIVKSENNVIYVHINNTKFVKMIMEYVPSNTAENKQFNIKILDNTIECRRGILSGWYATSGDTSNKCYTASKILIDQMDTLCTTLGIQTIRNESYDKNHVLYCLMQCDVSNESSEMFYKWHNNSIYFKIKSIELVNNTDDSVYCVEIKDDSPHFTLPNGIITHNCRMINDEEMLEMAGQSNSFGAGALASLGSHRVVTINYNRIALEAESVDDFWRVYKYRIEASRDILKAHKQLIKVLRDAGLQSFIENGWINMQRLFSTIGILGIYECGLTMQEKFGINPDTFKEEILSFLNKRVKRYTREEPNNIFNVEQIPAESFAVRLAKTDAILYGEKLVPHKLYANQFVPLWHEANVFERLSEDGKYNQLLTGGGIVHATIGERVAPSQARKIIEYAVKVGSEHFALNAIYSNCENNHMHFGDHDTCPECGANIEDKLQRVVGFFTPVKSWNPIRRDWEFPRRTKINLSTVDSYNE